MLGVDGAEVIYRRTEWESATTSPDRLTRNKQSR
jgi:hypothetical protein